MEDTWELMRARHSVRQYEARAIPQPVREALDAYADELNRLSGLRMQILHHEYQ